VSGWETEALWRFFLDRAIDPATMRPITPHDLWQQRKRLNRAQRYLEKAERPGPNRWALSQARKYLGLKPRMAP
jgi:hypothetical protein